MDHERQKDVERERLRKFIDKMLDENYDEDAPDDLRMDTFLIVSVYVWGDSEGEIGSEGVAVSSETKKQYAVRGILERGLDRVKNASESGDAW